MKISCVCEVVYAQKAVALIFIPLVKQSLLLALKPRSC